MTKREQLDVMWKLNFLRETFAYHIDWRFADDETLECMFFRKGEDDTLSCAMAACLAFARDACRILGGGRLGGPWFVRGDAVFCSEAGEILTAQKDIANRTGYVKYVVRKEF